MVDLEEWGNREREGSGDSVLLLSRGGEHRYRPDLRPEGGAELFIAQAGRWRRRPVQSTDERDIQATQLLAF